MPEAGVPEKSVDRRANLRFPLRLAVNYRTFNPALCSPSPPSALKTVNISSNGLVFEDNGGVQPGQRVLVSVEWPVRLDQRIPLNLVLEGRILRCEHGHAVLKIYKHEFKIRGSGPAQSSSPAHSDSEDRRPNDIEQSADAA